MSSIKNASPKSIVKRNRSLTKWKSNSPPRKEMQSLAEEDLKLQEREVERLEKLCQSGE